MKAHNLRKTALVMAAGIFVWWAWKAPAQDTPLAASPLPPAATQVVKLEQAKVSDNTIITYINTSGSSYGLDAGQIIYLKQQGVSDAVLNAMLTQPKYTAPATSAPEANMADVADTADQQTPPPSIVTTLPDDSASIIPPASPAPSVTYVPSAPTYYYSPSYYPYCASYNPVIYFPRVSFGWGWYGGGWRWGGGWHGTTVWHGGGTWHSGGSWHVGGGSHGGGGGHGGGWHR